MEMPHRLTSLRAAVNDDAEAGGGELIRPREAVGKVQRVPHERGMGLGGVSKRGNVLCRDNEDVRGGLRVDVFEREEAVCFCNNLSRDAASGDLAEQAISHVQ